ncbi:hypothetical protein MMC16_003252 [Acarospora aff. strigata]|nr:hypothetical protein [Acarospora aff. strigata]
MAPRRPNRAHYAKKERNHAVAFARTSDSGPSTNPANSTDPAAAGSSTLNIDPMLLDASPVTGNIATDNPATSTDPAAASSSTLNIDPMILDAAPVTGNIATNNPATSTDPAASSSSTLNIDPMLLDSSTVTGNIATDNPIPAFAGLNINLSNQQQSVYADTHSNSQASAAALPAFEFAAQDSAPRATTDPTAVDPILGTTANNYPEEILDARNSLVGEQQQPLSVDTPTAGPFGATTSSVPPPSTGLDFSTDFSSNEFVFPLSSATDLPAEATTLDPTAPNEFDTLIDAVFHPVDGQQQLPAVDASLAGSSDPTALSGPTFDEHDFPANLIPSDYDFDFTFGGTADLAVEASATGPSTTERAYPTAIFDAVYTISGEQQQPFSIDTAFAGPGPAAFPAFSSSALDSASGPAANIAVTAPTAGTSLADMQSQLEASKDVIANLESRVQREMETSETKIGVLEKSLADMQSQLEASKEAGANLERSLEEAKREEDALLSTKLEAIKELEETNARLRKESAEAEASKKEAHAQAEAAKNDAFKLKVKLKDRQNAIESLDKEVGDWKQISDSLSAKHQTLKEENEKLTAGIADREARQQDLAEGLKSRIEELKVQLAKAEERNTDEEISELKSKLNDQRRNNEREVSQYKTDLEKEMIVREENETRIKEQDASIRKFKADVRQHLATIESAENEVIGLREAAKESGRRGETHRTQRVTLKNETENLKNLIDEKDAQLKSASEDIRRLNATIQRQGDTIDGLEKTVGDYMGVKEECDRVKEELESTDEVMKELKGHLQDLEDEVSGLRSTRKSSSGSGSPPEDSPVIKSTSGLGIYTTLEGIFDDNDVEDDPDEPEQGPTGEDEVVAEDQSSKGQEVAGDGDVPPLSTPQDQGQSEESGQGQNTKGPGEDDAPPLPTPQGLGQGIDSSATANSPDYPAGPDHVVDTTNTGDNAPINLDTEEAPEVVPGVGPVAVTGGANVGGQENVTRGPNPVPVPVPAPAPAPGQPAEPAGIMIQVVEVPRMIYCPWLWWKYPYQDLLILFTFTSFPSFTAIIWKFIELHIFALNIPLRLFHKGINITIPPYPPPSPRHRSLPPAKKVMMLLAWHLVVYFTIITVTWKFSNAMIERDLWLGANELSRINLVGLREALWTSSNRAGTAIINWIISDWLGITQFDTGRWLKIQRGVFG